MTCTRDSLSPRAGEADGITATVITHHGLAFSQGREEQLARLVYKFLAAISKARKQGPSFRGTI